MRQRGPTRPVCWARGGQEAGRVGWRGEAVWAVEGSKGAAEDLA